MQQSSQTIHSREFMNSPPIAGRLSLNGQNKTKEKLEKLIGKTNPFLFKASTVFPFDFFPNDITIEQTKVNIVFREFFFSEDIHSVLIKTIKDVEVQTSLLFATLKIVLDIYPGKPIVIKYLKKSEALCARRIILGLMTIQEDVNATKENIDLSQITQEGAKKRVEELGTAHGAE